MRSTAESGKMKEVSLRFMVEMTWPFFSLVMRAGCGLIMDGESGKSMALLYVSKCCHEEASSRKRFFITKGGVYFRFGGETSCLRGRGTEGLVFS